MRHFARQRKMNSRLNLLESRCNLPDVTSVPLKIGLDISNVCNIKCIFCVTEGGRKKPSDPEAFRSPDMLDAYEPLLPFIETAILSSFEAILNPRFDQFVRRLHRYETPIQLFSNGLALTPELSEFLLRHSFDSLLCSFHGATADTYHSIMRGSNYDTVVKNLIALKVLAKRHNPGFELTLVFCAMRRTIGELCDFVSLAHSVGAKYISVNYLLVPQEDPKLEQESVFFHQHLYDAEVAKAKEKARSLGIGLNHQPMFSQSPAEIGNSPCYRPWQHMNINQNGDMQVCCGGAPVLGNLYASGFDKLWNSPGAVEFRSKVNSDNPPEACLKCTRGRETPGEVTSHLIYLRGLPEAKRLDCLRRLGLQEK